MALEEYYGIYHLIIKGKFKKRRKNLLKRIKLKIFKKLFYIKISITFYWIFFKKFLGIFVYLIYVFICVNKLKNSMNLTLIWKLYN